MKKILSLTLSCLSSFCFSQNEVKFTYSFQPNTTYITETTSLVKSTIAIEADEAMMEQLKSNGMELPMIMEQKSTFVLSNRTENLNEAGDLPLTMTYDKMEMEMSMNGNSMPQQPNPFEGSEIKATFLADGTMRFDSITGTNVNEQIKSMLKGMLGQVQRQIDFPDKPMVIGDSFENEIPMSMPIANMQPIDMLIKVHYTLKSIENSIAYFDVDQSLTLGSEQEAFDIKASGSGTGKLTYDIDNNFMLSYESNLPMKMEMDMQGTMLMKMDMDSSTKLRMRIE